MISYEFRKLSNVLENNIKSSNKIKKILSDADFLHIIQFTLEEKEERVARKIMVRFISQCYFCISLLNLMTLESRRVDCIESQCYFANQCEKCETSGNGTSRYCCLWMH
jgi:hypothetical protein